MNVRGDSRVLAPAVVVVPGGGWWKWVVSVGVVIAQLLVAAAVWLRRRAAVRAERAVAAERVRIARELHDVVAHHLSVITVQAGLARYVFASDPDTARDALEVIAAAGRQAQAELRHLLTALRSEVQAGGQASPPPGLGRLDGLVGQVRAAGLPVEVTVLGCPRQLAADLDLCAYRIIQESLTNVLKHAGPARVRVALEYRPAGLAVRIVDNGRRIGRAAGVGEVGHGLIGMRERVQMCGGTLTAGPRATGGFEVSLTLATAA